MPTILPKALNLSAAASELPAVRVFPSSRRAGVLAAAAAAAVLCAASPASADATVSPATAPQGTGANLTLQVVNDHPKAAITRIRLVLPAATPVAEVYPLSVPNWAPQITHRTLNPPMQSIHGGAPVTEATATITWTAAKGKALLPGKAANLMIAIGPLPETERMSFELLPTYADGSTAPAIPPAVLNLTPVAAPEVLPDEGYLLGPETDPTRPGMVSIIGWIIALLTGAAGVVLIVRSRRTGPAPVPSATRTEKAHAEPSADDAAASSTVEKATGAPAPRARVSAWSYRDGP
jgi:hypothetical protein